jgi:ubiquitin-protein ligase E3 C
LYREYIYKLSEKAFSQDNKMFIETSSGFLMPNPNSSKVSSMHLTIFEFLGFITGKAILDEINIWPNFSNFFLNNILDVENSFNELKNYDPDLFKNLVYLKDYEGDVEIDFGLDFTLTDNKDGNNVTVDLIENGKNINVNNNNKLLYIKKVAQYKLFSQIKEQCESFKKGLLSVFDGVGLRIFTSVRIILIKNELRQIITGLDKPIDIYDLKAYTVYSIYTKLI